MLRARRLVVIFAAGIAVLMPGPALARVDSSERGALIGVDAGSGRRQWRVELGGKQGTNLSVSYVGGGVVVGLEQRCLSADRAKHRSGDLTLVAFDATTGERLWTRQDAAVSYPGFASFGYHSSVGVVPVQTTGGKLLGVSLRTGEVRWSRGATIPATSEGNLAFSSGFGIMGTLGDSLLSSNVATILTTGGEPRLEAWRLRNGRSVWSADLGSESVSTFASSGLSLFALRSIALPAIDGSPARDTATRIDAVSLVDGKIVSKLDLGVVSSPYFPTYLTVTGREFVTGAWVNTGSVSAFDRVSGAMRWQRTGFLQFGLGDTVIVHDEVPATVVALDASTGVERWRFGGEAVQPSTNNTVVVSDFDPYKPGEGTTTAVDLATGKARWSRSHEPLGFGGTTRGISVLASPGCPVTSAD